MHNISSTLSLMFRRGASFLYDCLLLTATFFLITAIAVALNNGNAIQHPGYYLLLYCIGFVFFDWFWRHGGQTLGMRAWRIRVVGMNSEKMTFKQSLARYLSGSLLFGITLLYMPFSARGLALHDQLSRTKIVLHYR
ncbi:MAG: RDD family protein [Granulosicoccus sp.]|nr:RDD family protein [Granulosicoccus sp.]